ncbi:MAG: hypothetical protein L0Z62_02095 [Gemmataceae bacterium]|nr:hypothetical protein [Gemmataceae bacterium]
MAEEPDVIRERIEETRSALTEKLETLEDQVRETVQTAKETVEGTIENVKSSVQGTVQTVKRTFDLRYQVDRHPWAMVGGSLLTGFVLGNFVEGQRQQYLRAQRESAAGGPDQFRTQALQEGLADYRPNGSRSAQAQALAAEPSRPGMLSRLLHTFDDEIGKVKEVAIGACVGMVRDLAKQSFPRLAPQIDEVMNSATTKLGGQPVAGPLVEPRETATGSRTAAAGSRPEAWD